MNQHRLTPDFPTLALIEDALRADGLTPRGAFHPAAEDGVPEFGPGAPTRTVVLAGNAGPQMWRVYQGARGSSSLGLDEWSEKTLAAVAVRFGARAVFPFSRPHLPFQRWGMRAEACDISPVAMLVHPEYGLWHAYRGALLFANSMTLPVRAAHRSPCAGCARPCLSACPARAFSAGGYDADACAVHVRNSPRGACVKSGCQVRHACPVGRAYRYEPEQAQFHMRAFMAAHR